MSRQVDDIRSSIKTRRAALSQHERNAAAQAIAARLLKIPAIRRARSIAIYMPFRGEADCQIFARRAKLRKKRIFVPILRKSGLVFAPLKSAADMRPNHFGILEPVYQKKELLPAGQLDVVIAPLVAFDDRCNRIGMGGGFYDRCFAFRKFRRNWLRPRLIGVAYDFQRVEQLSPEAWDVPLDMIVTEQNCYGSN
jgi:5-formyltetrahydrofolate cyclo-ligase